MPQSYTSENRRKHNVRYNLRDLYRVEYFIDDNPSGSEEEVEQAPALSDITLPIQDIPVTQYNTTMAYRGHSTVPVCLSSDVSQYPDDSTVSIALTNTVVSTQTITYTQTSPATNVTYITTSSYDAPSTGNTNQYTSQCTTQSSPQTQYSRSKSPHSNIQRPSQTLPASPVAGVQTHTVNLPVGSMHLTFQQSPNVHALFDGRQANLETWFANARDTAARHGAPHDDNALINVAVT